MPRWVIDDRGLCWDEGSPGFRDAFYLHGIAGNVVSMLTDKLGFIEISSGSFGPVIRFKPKYVTGPALAGLAVWLWKNRPSRIALMYDLPGQPTRQQLVKFDAAGKALEDIMGEVRAPRSPFALVSDGLDELRDVPALGPLFEHWRASGGTYDEADYLPLLKQRARDRYVMFSPRSARGDLQIVRAGAGLHIPDRESHAALPGLQLAKVADQTFAQWSAGIYERALACQEPRFDQISGSIRWPSTGAVVRRYWRLILPCWTKDRKPLLLGISCDPTGPDFDPEVG